MARHDGNDNMLTPREVAKMLHVHPNTLKRWSEKGRIVAYRINPRGDRRYWRRDIVRFLAEFNPGIDSTS